MTSLEEFFAPPSPDDVLHADLMAMIRARHHATPRHQQIALGPSAIGHPCMRKLAYGLMNAPTCNPYDDPLPSIIGTASHTWMESAATLANTELHRDRWLTEQKVEVAPGLNGHADLYDCDTATVIDYKFPGKNRFDTYRRKMSVVYRAQGHLYGKGFVRAGYPVKRIAICMLPRGGSLASMHLWTEDYRPEVADAVLARRTAVIAMLNDFDIESHPERYEWFAKSPLDCLFCPYFSPKPDGPYQCQGDQ